MSMDRKALASAIEKHKIPQLIVGYLKLQQANNNDFFTLMLENKINGRLFYNTCVPGAKEIKYGNEDFTHSDLKIATDKLLNEFSTLSLAAVKAESVKPSTISDNMRTVISSFLDSIESSREWKHFWESEINLKASISEKKRLYNMIAGAAAYKAFISCIDQSSSISDPMIKRNIAGLISLCTNHYASTALRDEKDMPAKNKAQESMGDFSIFKTPSATESPAKIFDLKHNNLNDSMALDLK